MSARPEDRRAEAGAARPRSGALPVLRLVDDELPGGPWIWARRVELPREPVADGALVEVVDRSDRFVGHGLYNGNSDIRLRLLSRGRRKDLERPRQFLLKRIKDADDLRRKVLRLHERGDAYRVVHAEGDLLPGLVVDRLADWLVVEHHALGFWNLREDVTWALGQLYPGLNVLHRVPRSARGPEAFPAEVLAELDARPDAPEIRIEEDGLVYRVVPGGGHKTGWFCDQRDNRLAVAALARGRDVLDLCCNQGGFALRAAAAGARRVTAVDLDERALERAARSSEDAGLAVRWVHADAFDHLRSVLRDTGGPSRPGIVIVDPHKMIPSKARLEEGRRKYLDLNALAIEAARPGGLVATFSCSGALDERLFVGLLFQAARRAERGVRLLRRFEAGPDHPQRPDFPRSRYLKGALLAVD